MDEIRDEDKQHSHRVADATHLVQYSREAGKRADLDAKKVSGTGSKIMQHYIDLAGRPTVVREKDGRTDVFVGDDQIQYFPDGPAKTKWMLTARAEELAARPWSETSVAFRDLHAEWKTAGAADRSTESVLWPRFKAAMDRHYEARKVERSSNKSDKERVVSRAESLAGSSDLRAAGDEMRKLGDEWKRIGPCEKADNDRLWARFNSARTKLSDRKKQQFEQRQREWASNKSAKERLVSQMSTLTRSSDFRAAKEQARSLDAQWRLTGPCEKADNDRLWQSYKSAKEQVWAAAKQAGEQRRIEARQRAQDRVHRLESQLSNVEAAIYRAEQAYSRALSARSPSMKNPNWMQIVNSQQARQSAVRDKIVSLGQRKSEIISKLGDARSRLNQF